MTLRIPKPGDWDDDPWSARLGYLDESGEAQLEAALLGKSRTRSAVIARRRSRRLPSPMALGPRPVTVRNTRSFHFRHSSILKHERQGHRMSGSSAAVTSSKSNGRSGRVAARTSRPGASVVPRYTAARFQAYVQRSDRAREDSDLFTLEPKRRGDGVSFVEAGSIGDTPAERIDFWQRLEDYERSGQRVQCRLIAELPYELHRSPELVADLARTVVQPFVDRGLPVYAAVHRPSASEADPDGNRNLHLHLLYSERPASRDVDGHWVFSRRKHADTRGWDWVPQLRDCYADAVNAAWQRHDALQRPHQGLADQAVSAKRSPRFDPNTYEAMGIDKEPEVHLGDRAWRLELAGLPTRHGVANGLKREAWHGYQRPLAESAAAIADDVETMRSVTDRLYGPLRQAHLSFLTTPETAEEARACQQRLLDLARLADKVERERLDLARGRILRSRLSGRLRTREKWVRAQVQTTDSRSRAYAELYSEQAHLGAEDRRTHAAVERLFRLGEREAAWSSDLSERKRLRDRLAVDASRMRKLSVCDAVVFDVRSLIALEASGARLDRLMSWDKLVADTERYAILAAEATSADTRAAFLDRKLSLSASVEAGVKWRAEFARMKALEESSQSDAERSRAVAVLENMLSSPLDGIVMPEHVEHFRQRRADAEDRIRRRFDLALSGDRSGDEMDAASEIYRRQNARERDRLAALMREAPQPTPRRGIEK